MQDDEVAPELPPEVSGHLRDRAAWAEPPAELEADVLTALRAARAAAAPSTDVGPTGTGPADELTRARERRAARRPSPKILLAAASSVVLAVLAVAGL